MAATEAAPLKTEPQKPSQENSNDSNNQRGPGGPGGPGIGGGGRGGGGRGRKGGSRFSGGRGGGMGGGGGGPGRNDGGGPGRNDGGGPGRNDVQMKMSESMDAGMDGVADTLGMGGPGLMGSGPGGMCGPVGMGGMGGGPGGMGRGGMMRGGRGGGRGGDRGPMGQRSQDDRLMERIMTLAGPTHELPPQDTTEKKFSGRNRLYVGNLTSDVTEEEIQTLFSQYGEVSELFVNTIKNFAFLRMDYRVNAEKAKLELNGTMRKGRALKVRFAPHSSTVKVKNLTPWISNELLEKSFSVFGEIERAIVVVDDRGKTTGEGIVEYCRKPCAQLAVRKCTEGCYFLTASLRPVVVEMFEQQDDIDGYPDKNLSRKNPEFYKAREVGPRFAMPGSFEHEYGTRWKQLHELYKQKEEALKREMAMEEGKLEAQMEFARYEHETELLREQLRMREADRERQKREWEMKEREAEEQRSRDEELRRRQQEDMAMRIRRQEEELHRRQQENNIFMQEQAMRGTGGGGGGSGGGGGGGGGVGGVCKSYDNVSNSERDGYGAPDGGNNLPVDPKSFMDAYNNLDRSNRGGGGYNDDRGQIMDLMDMRVDMGNMPNNRGNNGGGGGGGGGVGAGGGGGGGGRWQGGNNDRNRPDDFPNSKRRRY